jgi:hypothetical protein
MLYRNNVAPEQVLFDAWCADYQDELAHIAIAEAAENLLREGYESTDDEDDRVCLYLPPYFCVSYLLGVYRDVLSGGLSVWRALCLEGCFSVFFFVFLSLSCLRGWINFLFATRWYTPFI